MSKQVNWNKYIYNRFCEEAMLSDEEKDILESRLKGWTITKQSIEFNMSESKVNKIIATLKRKYDNIQKYCDDLPKRRKSSKEDYMDNN